MVVLLPATILLCKAARLDGLGELASGWPGFCFMGGCIAYIHWRPLPKLLEASYLALATILITIVLSLIVQIAGRSPYPLVDRQLAALDGAFNLHTAYFVHSVSAWPVLRMALSLGYMTIAPLVIASVIVPPLIGHADRSYRFIVATIVGLSLTVAVFYRWPSVGPWTVEGYAPTPSQVAVARYLGLLRSNAEVRIDMNHAGIISFPSFHVVLALLSAYALNCVHRLRWLGWSLCVVICISTVTTGWHYGVDVIAGLMIAAASIATAIWILKQARIVF